MKSYDLKKEGAALRADFESMTSSLPPIAPDLQAAMDFVNWVEEFLALHQWLISGFFPLSDDSPTNDNSEPRPLRFPKHQRSFGDEMFKQENKTSGIETKVTVSETPPSGGQIGTLRDLSPAMITEHQSPKPETGVPTSVPETQDRGKTSVVVRQPSGGQIGTLRDLAQELPTPRRSVTGVQGVPCTIPERPSDGQIGTLRDLAQDINNELTDQSFDPRRSVTGVQGAPCTIPERPNDGKIGTLRDLAQDINNELTEHMITESPKVRQPSKIGTLRDLAQDINNELTDQSFDLKPRRSVAGVQGVPCTIPERPSDGKIGTQRDLAQDINNELTDQSFDPRRSVTGVQGVPCTIPERPSDGKIGTLRDLSPAMITESPKRETGVPTSVPEAQDRGKTSVVVRQPSGGQIETLRDLAQDINNELTALAEPSFDLKPAELANPRRSESVDAPESLSESSAGLPKPRSSVDASGVQGAPCTSDIELLLNTIIKEIESEYKRHYGES